MRSSQILSYHPDEPATDHCGSCTLCLQTCPTGAITEPYLVDAQKCLSYLTIEFRGKEEEIPKELRKKIGNHLFGCDDCLDICPYNNNENPTGIDAFHPSSITQQADLHSLSRLKEEEFTSIFRTSAIRRAKHHGFLRNIHMIQAQKGEISSDYFNCTIVTPSPPSARSPLLKPST